MRVASSTSIGRSEHLLDDSSTGQVLVAVPNTNIVEPRAISPAEDLASARDHSIAPLEASDASAGAAAPPRRLRPKDRGPQSREVHITTEPQANAR